MGIVSNRRGSPAASLSVGQKLKRADHIMSGRRGGRGRVGRSNLEAIGIAPGESLPPPILQPPPLYPPMERRPLELSNTETDRYLVGIKQEFQQRMQQSPFYLKSDSARTDIKRYSDKYKMSAQQSDLQQLLKCIPSWDLFPRELRLSRKRRARSASRYNPLVSSSCRQHPPSSLNEDTVRAETGVHVASSIDNTLSKLEEMEKTGANTEEGTEEELVDDEVYDEEVEEEEGDYQLSYFDPGEDFVVDEDDALEDSHF